jgi:2-amino-4-deoxychorismate synthase
VNRPSARLLDAVLSPNPPAFAILHRPAATGPDHLEILLGDVTTPQTVGQLALSAGPAAAPGAARHEMLAVIPYRQISERGFACADDGAPLLALSVAEQGVLPVAEFRGRVPNVPTKLSDAHFDIEDEAYAETVRRVIADEIGQGVGANFVIKRSFVATIEDYSPLSALSFFSRLLARESGSYWTFLVHTGGRTFVGATPERHVSLERGTAVMNPISGTYRYPATGPTLAGVMEFLTDQKETDELFMVVDEELKMMSRVCEGGGRVVGPYLKEMAKLAHTEYLITGHSTMDPRDILRETMFAPTVTGSPLESACRVVAKYEPEGRGYYSGVVALIGRDEDGGRAMDSAILIRTAEIGAGGRVRIGVGATLVRHSDPDGEAAETRAKASGLVAALQADTGPVSFADHPAVRAALDQRNAAIAQFWRAGGEGAAAEGLEELEELDRPLADPALAGRKVLVVDNEDTFTGMIGEQLEAMGLEVAIRRFDEDFSFDGHDLVVMGPGPGDPREADHPKIARLRAAVDTLLAEQRPFLAVCLSHQVLSLRLGLGLVRRATPNQGVQREIGLFGASEAVGFYNTFAARCEQDVLTIEGIGTVEVSADPETGEVHALRSGRFASMQFHAESVLTQNGPRITAGLLRGLVEGAAAPVRPQTALSTQL